MLTYWCFLMYFYFKNNGHYKKYFAFFFHQKYKHFFNYNVFFKMSWILLFIKKQKKKLQGKQNLNEPFLKQKRWKDENSCVKNTSISNMIKHWWFIYIKASEYCKLTDVCLQRMDKTWNFFTWSINVINGISCFLNSFLY